MPLLWSYFPPNLVVCFGRFGNPRSLVSGRGKVSTRCASLESVIEYSHVECRTRPSFRKASDTGDTSANTSSTSARYRNAPLVDALKASAEQDVACFHFPGHNRGKAAPSPLTQLIGASPFTHDLPELPELDDLFSPKGVILDAQKQASELFGSCQTWFLVGGTTCGIQASIMATCSPGETLILPRNSHISAISAMVLSGAAPKYILPEYSWKWDIAGGVTSSQVEQTIKDLEGDGKKAGAVMVTSPTYHGVCSNLSEIATVCHFHGIPLIVDEAHGAHLRFHPQFPCSALEQGADLVVQSTHKVLGSLTQSSMLHMSGKFVDKESISRCLQLLQSSSPSYLLLASLDATRAQISENPESIFNKALSLSTEARYQIKQIPGLSLLSLPSFVSGFPDIDPLRLTVGVWQLSMTGYVADDILAEEHHVISELVGSQSITFAINLGTRRVDIQKLVIGLQQLSAASFQETEVQHENYNHFLAPFTNITMRLTPREAFFAKKMKVNIAECEGKICGELICPYPPGIPVLIPGEVITEEALSYLLDVKEKGAMISGAADHELSSIVVCKP